MLHSIQCSTFFQKMKRKLHQKDEVLSDFSHETDVKKIFVHCFQFTTPSAESSCCRFAKWAGGGLRGQSPSTADNKRENRNVWISFPYTCSSKYGGTILQRVYIFSLCLLCILTHVFSLSRRLSICAPCAKIHLISFYKSKAARSRIAMFDTSNHSPKSKRRYKRQYLVLQKQVLPFLLQIFAEFTEFFSVHCCTGRQQFTPSLSALQFVVSIVTIAAKSLFKPVIL